jgi:autotransporter-associated beta strand protein
LGQASKRRREQLHQPAKKYRRKAFLEALEARQVLTLPMPIDVPEFPIPQPDNPAAHIRQGWLFVSAAESTAHDNQLTISSDDAGTIYIRDSELAWLGTGGIPGAELSLDGKMLIIPGGAITGQQILINGGGGNDNLTVDFVGGNPIPLGGLEFNGGGQTSERGDEITLVNGEVESVDYVFINENDGSITIDGRTLNYTGLEPVTDNLSPTTRSFTFTGPAETISVTDGATGDGMTEIDSDLAGEIVAFVSSATTTSVTIITNGGDTTNISSFDPGFNASLLSLQGTTTNNTYNLGGSIVLPTTTLSLTGNVVFSLNGNNAQIDALASTNATPVVGLTTGQVLTIGGSTTATYSGVLTGGGGLTRTGTGTQILSGTGPTYTGPNVINSGVLRITAANAAGTGTTTISGGGVFEINNVTHNAAIALNGGGILRGLGASARENGIITLAAGVAVSLAATSGSTLTLGNATNDLTGGAGTTITIDGGGIVAQTQSSNAGAATNPVRWNVINGSSLQISADLQFGTVPAPAITNFLTLDNGTLRNATTASITMSTGRGITLGAGGATVKNTTGTNITFAGLISAPVPVPLNVVGPGNGALILTGNAAGPNQFSALNIDDTRFYVSGTSANAVGAATVPINVTNSGQFGYLNSASSITIPNPITMASGTTMVSRAVTTFSLTLSGVVTLPTSGIIIFNNEATANGLINFTGPNSGENALNLTGDLTIQVGENTAGTPGDAGQVNLNHEISGPFGIIKTEEGTLQLSGASTYTGITTIQEGILNATTIGNYGETSSIGARTLAMETATGNGIGLHFTGGTLQYTGSAAESTDRQIRVSTAGGAIDSSGTGTLSFTYSGANINWFDTAGARTLTLTGTNTGLNVFANQIHNQAASTGLTNLTKSGAGRWQLNNSASSYTGITSFSGGILNVTSLTDYGVAGPLGARALAEESATGDDIGLVFRSGTLQYTGSTAQSTNRQIRVQNTGGTIDASGTGAGTLSFTHSGANINWFDTPGTRTFTLTGSNTGNNTFANLIQNQAANATSVSKTGAGTWSLTNTGNTYTGSTTVSAGTLTGGGTTGPMTVNSGATHAPGTNVGTTTVNGNYVANGAVAVQIDSATGNTPGVDYDQLRIMNSGSVTLGAASTLVVSYTGAAGTFNPPLGQTYIIINNDGTAAADTAGKFAGLGEGAIVTLDGKSLAISYVGGDGNDVTLTAVAPVSIVYIDDDFPAGPTVDGDSETGGMQSAMLGTEAFASIDAALAALPPNWSGIMVVNGGTYASANLAGGGNVTLRLVQDLVATTANNVTIQNLTGSAGDTIITRYFNSANANLTVEQGNFAGVISGLGDFTKTTAGVLTLGGQNTYAGSTTITGGLVVDVANALPTTTVVTLGSAANTGTLDLNFNQTLSGLLIRSNTATANTIDIAPTATLAITGTSALSIGVSGDGQVTNANFIGGGALNVTNAAAGTIVTLGIQNTAQANAQNTVDVDMTGLSSVIIDVETIRVGWNSKMSAIVKLSNTSNTITANLLTIGDSVTNNAGSPIRVELGTGTNAIQANTLTVGAGKGSASLQFASQAPGSPGTLLLTGRAGGTSVVDINVGVNTQVDTGTNITGTVNLQGHAATVQADTVILGRTTRATLASGAAGNLLVDAGTASIATLSMADKSGASTGVATGNLTIGGGTLTVATAFTMGVQASGGTSVATLNITGGTLTSTPDLLKGAGATTATINISGGTLNVTNDSIGTAAAPIVLNFSGGSLLNVNDYNGSGLITKTLLADGTLSGSVTSPVTVSGGKLFLQTTVAALQVDAGATLVPGISGARQIVTSGNYTQNGTLEMQITHATNDVAGTDYDQLKVTGTVTLGGPLNLTYTGAGAFAGNSGQLYTLIDNDGTADATIGTFAGFAEGATVGTFDGIALSISYKGGDGNDVTLSAVAGVPAIIYIDDNFPASGLVADANLEALGNQPATMDTDAFASIDAALTKYPNYSGNLFVNGGTYASAPLAGGGSVTIRLLQDLTPAANVVDVTLQNLTGDGGDTIVTRGLGAANGNLIVEQGSFAGLITGAGNLTKTSAGTLTLSRANNYSGSTNIADGTLQ